MSRPAPPAASLSPRQELFALALASGSTAAEAYRAAGFKPHRSNAARLSANDSVRRRVAELQARALRRADVTIDTLLEELESARQQALAEGRCAAAVAATMGKARLVGLGGESRTR